MYHLYKDFQWKIIFKILSVEKHFNLFIDKEKQNIDNVDEKVVNDILSKKYMKGSNLDVLKSMFNMVLLHHVDNDDSEELKLPYLDHSIVNLLNSFRLASLNETSEGYALLSNFKSINDMVIIKTAKDKSDNLNILYEYFIGSIGINKLRNIIPNFTYTLAIFKCNPLPIQNSIIDTNEFCSGNKSDSRFYVVYEKIAGESLDSFVKGMKTPSHVYKLISYLIQISLALQVAQQEINFTHYDLHSNNIILRKLPEPIVVEYNINNKIYKIETDAIPTIIDYGFSHFQYRGVQFGITDIQSLGINPTKMSKGYDLYKLFNFVLNFVYQEDIKKKTGLFSHISWILDYYHDKEDPYGIYRAFKNSFSRSLEELQRAFSNGWKNFFAVLPISSRLYNTEPLSFVQWMEKTHPATFKKFIKLSDIEYSKPTNNLLDSYQSKMDGRRIFKTDIIDEIKDCDILDTDHKSYIINKYIVQEFKNILDRFGEYIKDKTILEDKITKLDDKSEKNKHKYKHNDNELLSIYKNELQQISSKIDIDKYIKEVDKIKDIIDIKQLNSKIDTFIKYNETYDNYKIFIDYSKLSDRIYTDAELENFYYSSKQLYIDFSRKKSEYIFNSLRIYLNNITSIIYDYENDVYIDPRNWSVGENFYKSIRLVQYILSDIRYFYPDVSYACDDIEIFISKIISSIGVYHNVYLYMFTKSLRQIKQAFSCDSDRLIILIMKSMKRDVSPIFIRNFIAELLDRDKNDMEIYTALQQYDNKSSFDKDKRAHSRVRDLSFLFNYPQFNVMRNEKNFKYLDIGGEDGSITSAIGHYINLGKSDIISADVDDWFDKTDKNKDITYVMINKTGKLPFMDNTFSLITAFQVLHHIEDIENRLREISRITKKGGFLVIREHDNKNECIQIMCDIEHSIYEMVLKENPSSDFLDKYRAWYRSFQQWTSLIESYGFKYINDVSYNNDMRIKNPTRTYYSMYIKL